MGVRFGKVGYNFKCLCRRPVTGCVIATQLYLQDQTVQKEAQQLIGVAEFSAGRTFKNSFVLISVGEENFKNLRTSQVPSLFLVETERGGTGSKYDFLQYMTCNEFDHGTEELLKCVCLLLSTDDGVNRSRDGTDEMKR